ncbi:hypothetical protein AB0J28_14320 [Streptosporangium canum]
MTPQHSVVRLALNSWTRAVLLFGHIDCPGFGRCLQLGEDVQARPC